MAADDRPSPGRPPTMEDVAARAGVSRALVSLVMRGSPKVSDRRRTAVLAAARELGYRPNAAARSLAEQRSNTIGVVINDLHNPFFADVVDGIHDRASDHQYRLLFNAAWRTETDEERALDRFIEYRVDGIIVVGPRAGADVLRDADKAVPVVLVGSSVDGIDSIVNDDERGGELVVDHLVELGHRDIVHVDGGSGAGAIGRRRGFVNAMVDHGFEPRLLDGDFTEQSGVDAVDQLLATDRVPTAIFAANDLAAVGALGRLSSQGVLVPRDVSVVGYDNSSLAGLGHIGLTTIDQPRVEMGRVAMTCLFERIDHGRRAAVSTVVQPELVVRSTTGPATA